MRFLSYFFVTLISALLLSTTAFSQNTIEGYLLYHNNPNKPIPGSEVTLTSQEGGPTYSVTTDNLGKYIFINIPGGTYQLTATTTLSAGGLTLGDSYIILLDLLGFNTLSPIQQLAADVTGDGQVEWDDYTSIVTGWFLNGNPFPVGEWAFDTTTVTTGLKDNTNLGGTSAGDVNGGYIPNLTKGDEMYVQVENNNENTRSVTLNLTVTGNLTTTGFGIVFDLSPETQITNIYSSLKNFEYVVVNSQLRVSWINLTGEALILNESEAIFTIEGNNLELTPTMESHFINTDGDIIPNVSLKTSAPTFTELDFSIKRLYQSGLDIILECYTSEEQNISIRINDMSGKAVSVVNTKTTAGMNQFKIIQQSIPTGIYTCNVISDIQTNKPVSRKFFVNN